MAQDLLLCPDCGGIIGASTTTDAGRPCICFGAPTPEVPAGELADPFGEGDPNDTAVMPVPDDGRKSCCMCGKDVSGTKRMRDERGYWCYACHKLDKYAKLGVSGPPPKMESSSAARSSTRESAAGSSRPPKMRKPGIICPSCGKSVKESDMEEFAGELVCGRCKREKVQEGGHLADRFNTAERKREETKNVRLQLMIVMGVILAGVAAYQWDLLPGMGSSGSELRDLIAGARVLAVVVLGLILAGMWWVKRNV